MNRPWCMAVVPCLLALAGLVPNAARATEAARDPGPEDILVELDSRPGEPSRFVTVAVLPAPPERVWEIIDRCADYKANFIGITESVELARAENSRRCKVTVSMPFPFADLTSVSEVTNTLTPGKAWKKEWELLEGDYKHNSGRWTLTPYGPSGTRTLVVYELMAEPNVRIPMFIINAVQKITMPMMINKLRGVLTAPGS